MLWVSHSAVARALIGGGGVYSYFRALPDEFLLKISRAEHEYMDIHPHPLPPINALAAALVSQIFVR